MIRDKTSVSPRICLSCRRKQPRGNLVRLLVENQTSQVILNPNRHQQGRSVYLCRLQSCLELALKGQRLKANLEGRKKREARNQRRIAWPLEPQLIQLLRQNCSEPEETCQNTQRKEGSE